MIKERINLIVNINKFIIVAVICVAATLFLANHVADLLFGKNSLEVYTSLTIKEVHLRNEIKRLQQENAKLQKEYFELKNLEPEE